MCQEKKRILLITAATNSNKNRNKDKEKKNENKISPLMLKFDSFENIWL